MNPIQIIDSVAISLGGAVLDGCQLVDKILIGTGGVVLDGSKPVVLSAIAIGPGTMLWDEAPNCDSKRVTVEFEKQVDYSDQMNAIDQDSIPMLIPSIDPIVVIDEVEVPIPEVVPVVSIVEDYPKYGTGNVDTTKYTRRQLRKMRIQNYAEGVFQDDFGLPAGLATAMLRFESRTGDLMVSKTNCQGYYQFCSKTAKAYGLTRPHDLVESTYAAGQLAADNRDGLSNLDISGTAFHIYLSHVIGLGNTNTLQQARAGVKVPNKKELKLVKALKPNWYKGMGARPVSINDSSRKFYNYFGSKFDKLKPKNPTKPQLM